MKVSVVLSTYNPDPERLRATLEGLRNQTLAAEDWELVLVNNASTRFPDAAFLAMHAPRNVRIVEELAPGLSHARQCGLRVARGQTIVLLDDDNVLASSYLETAFALFSQHSVLGAMGGKSAPRFSSEPEPWTHEFFPLLALRDLGESEKISSGLRPAGSTHNRYPDFSPIGAGMALRCEAARAWLEASTQRPGPSDRRGDALSSGGDNDIVLTVMKAGWEVGYFPQLSLSHLIPRSRLDPGYLARLNRGIQRSWMQVLTLHDANPWPPLSGVGAAMRKAKAYAKHRAWSSPAARIRWQGACGHFDGRVPGNG